MPHLKEVTIFTDGACLGNPGPGGCAAILVYGEHRKELKRGYRWTTNNRMELMALVMALEALKYSCIVSIHADSKYLLDAFRENWIERWKQKGWRTRSRTEVQNIDLWKRIDELMQNHHPSFSWIKGHSGHAENTRCDKLALSAATHSASLIDQGYESIHPYQKQESNKSIDAAS
jgi:ribonuclease HI